MTNKKENKENCTCESKGRTVWRLSSNGVCLRCGKPYKSA